ncbi:hypothetical protein NF715_09240 [Lactococcus formosensis]|nr:hypothetical protein [Lactococcus formosensis]MDG6112388.1 hypothetical protein [Lactococcus formosensis]MDG6118653.1 hypothetical protein [Lactococcus formosensis]MDG6133466.1 hypothetical protein [Lactococcus formosensis]MDG6135463.1 hypothetical protein [Lactococcus formosensis]MDG6139556.1 hypothetical protein [Lactococcus formosensis]
MTPDKKRKLRNIAILSFLGLIGGTFAFTAFNQQAINDRLRDNEVEVGGRVHDYYNRDTENKDVFVENYGQTPIMARIRLSEFMEIQERGQENFTPVVEGTSRENTQGWSTYIPSANNLNIRTGEGADRLNQYSNLTFGWIRGGQIAPWYLPTFNHDEEDLRTASARDARDYLEEGATHPGEGTDGDWSEGESHDNSAGTWPGSMVIRETAQNLPQDHEPITLQAWATLEEEKKNGNFWVIDQNTGWAYWANVLNAGQTTSYLLDAAEMTPTADAINGTYYYGIHVDSQLISPEQEFEDENSASGDLSDLLTSIRTDADGNPFPDTDAPVSAFNFSRMESGRIFTMAGEQYRYLEDMGEGNHMIIRSKGFHMMTEVPIHIWYGSLDPEVHAIVQPVGNLGSVNTGVVGNMTWENGVQGWIPNLDSIAAEDLTTVNEEIGTKQAFNLTLGDVTRLSRNGVFSSPEERIASDGRAWMLRTGAGSSGPISLSWRVGANGLLSSASSNPAQHMDSDQRPALIINQGN